MEDQENAVEEVPEETPEPKLNVICDVENPDPDSPGSVQVTATKSGNEAKIYYNFGEDLDEMVSLYGDSVVYSYAKGQMVIRLQAAMRSRMLSGGDIAGLMTEFKPGIALPKTPQDMSKATENYFATLSDEEQDAMIAKLMERKGA